jgi:hypothetical protein
LAQLEHRVFAAALGDFAGVAVEVGAFRAATASCWYCAGYRVADLSWSGCWFNSREGRFDEGSEQDVALAVSEARTRSIDALPS